jgi:hypothetical protein
MTCTTSCRALTVISISSSARMRAAYETASSEVDIVRCCRVVLNGSLDLVALSKQITKITNSIFVVRRASRATFSLNYRIKFRPTGPPLMPSLQYRFK